MPIYLPQWCFYGLVSYFSLFKRKINDENCTACNICATKKCPTRAISGEKSEKTSPAECIICGVCTSDKRKCNFFGFSKPVLPTVVEPDLSRRQAVAGIFTGLFSSPILMNMSVKMRRKNLTPIRPPGAIKEDEFLARCITCGACMSVCPQKALHPATLTQDGIILWNTPKLVARIGYCEKDCTICSHTCPSGALIPITTEEKLKRKIGVAVIHRERCRPWLNDKKCSICIDKCPYDGALSQVVIERDGKKVYVPEVNKRKCMGCGICEYSCPVRHEPAIQVFSHMERRINIKKKR